MSNLEPMAPARCPACDSLDLQPLEIVNLEFQHRAYTPDPEAQDKLTTLAGIPANSYQMQRCARCGLEFCDPLKAPNDAWYCLVYKVLPLYPTQRWEFDFIPGKLTPGARVGEIGCGDGAFLDRCRAAGLPAIGVDFSQDAITVCTAAGLDAHIVDVDSGTGRLPTSHDRNVIVAFQVLEHLAAPGSLFELATAWSTPDATLWVAIPSNLRPSRFFGETDFLDQPPHHMTRWTAEALAAIGRKHGWKMNEMIYEPLSFMTYVWWLATRSALYKALPAALHRVRLIELGLRLAIYPFAAARALWLGKAVSSQTMLASYLRALD